MNNVNPGTSSTPNLTMQPRASTLIFIVIGPGVFYFLFFMSSGGENNYCSVVFVFRQVLGLKRTVEKKNAVCTLLKHGMFSVLDTHSHSGAHTHTHTHRTPGKTAVCSICYLSVNEAFISCLYSLCSRERER